MVAPLEVALVSCSSSDPYSTLIIDPRTGVSVWSLKGSELQGQVSSGAYPLNNGDYLAISLADKPLLHVVSVHVKDRFHQKSVLPGPVTCVAFSPDATICCAAIHESIYTWMTTTGQLHSVIRAHYQNIVKVSFSSDATFLVSVGKDGLVQVWLTADVLAIKKSDIEKPEPTRKWSPHSLAITDVHVTSGPGSNCRLLTCSLDQTAFLHSVSSNECLLRIIVDSALTACCMDPAESRLFLGTAKGVIVQVDLFSEPAARERHAITIADSGDMALFKHHTCAVTCLNTNVDGTSLISGDKCGTYCIWDIASRQCMKSATMRGDINTAKFIPFWQSLADSERYEKRSVLPMAVLQKNVAKSLQASVPVSLIAHHDMTDEDEALDNSILKLFHTYQEETSKTPAIDQSEKIWYTAQNQVSEKDIEILEEDSITETKVAKLERQLQEAERVNRQLYEFSLKHIVDNKTT